ncbi:hypothetical protein SDC9_73494 [bioreactor metagenome]|uniref:Uncharacterized protein n=1 Tax=bioreactor metagenome TaxID=1076179 RepID=A0A644YF74_9ZZZZ
MTEYELIHHSYKRIFKIRLRDVFHGTFLSVLYMIGTAPCDIMPAGGVDATLEFATALTADDFA